ncbi:MAG: hypothetical protein WBG71_11230 [Leeuwenhoekiella sp.]
MNQEQKSSIKNIKRLIWVYFLLLIFEGALRKWVLPGLAAPLLIIRDPVAIAMLFLALYHRLWKPNLYVSVMWIITLIGVCTALLFGHGYLSVALYGLRITFFHFPIIFIIGQFFEPGDLLKLGKILLWITIGMTILVALQFYSPQTAWVNRGIGGDMSGSGFSGAEGFYRVPGTFSFTNGLSYFYNLATCFIFYYLINKKTAIHKVLLYATVIALIAAVPLTISRTVFFQICLTLFFIILASVKNRKLIFRIFGGIIVTIVMLLIMNNFYFFQTATSAFTTRFETANASEGGAVEGVLIDRFLGGMLNAVERGSDSFFGHGLGLGSQAGAKLAGSSGFLISEGEWGRIIGEQGILFGLFLILIRVVLGINLLKSSWTQIRNENILPWILSSFGFVVVIQGQWAQPTTLGFAILTSGFILVAIKKG